MHTSKRIRRQLTLLHAGLLVVGSPRKGTLLARKLAEVARDETRAERRREKAAGWLA